MGRPKKSQIAEVSVSAMQENTNEETSQFTENEQLRKEIAELKAALNQLLSNKENTIAQKDKEVVLDELDDLDEYNNIKINNDDYVKVISLIDNELNLNTRPYGRGGKTYKFTKRFDVKRILYRELVEILENHPSFVEAGYFYILSKNVIRKHGLNAVYENILSKEQIEYIMSSDSNDAVSLFKSANEKQQETIVEMLIKKLTENPESLDLNMVDKISRASGVKIQEKADDARVLIESMKNNKN